MGYSKIHALCLKYGINKVIKKALVMLVPGKSILQLRILKEKYDKYNKLCRKYSGKVKVYASDENSFEANQTIYSAWFQGEESAPQIVKACWTSIRQNLSNYRLLIITNENYNNYVKLNPQIIEKYEHGIIGCTHFSDIIRTKILIDHGGLWLDSTVLCTSSRLVDYLCKNDVDLFVYQNFKSEDISSVLSNWLIYAKKNNVILRSTYDLLEEYWKNNNKLIDYFLYHKFFTIVVKQYALQWAKVPVVPNSAPHLMQAELFKCFNAPRFDMLCGLSSFHKLTYKFSNEQSDLGNTLYQYILNKYT